MAVTNEKPAVTNDTVADLAEARQKDEQALLEERGHRIIEISRFGEVPKLFDNLRRIGGSHEKVGNQPEAPGYVAVKRAESCQSNRRKPFGITLTACSGFDIFLANCSWMTGGCPWG